MEDIIICRKQTKNKSGSNSHESPRISINLGRGTFVIFDKAMKLLSLDQRGAVMFAFNRSTHSAYIFKEIPADDNYILGSAKNGACRFCSKDLMLVFTEFFDIKDETYLLFDLELTPYRDQWFKIIPCF